MNKNGIPRHAKCLVIRFTCNDATCMAMTSTSYEGFDVVVDGSNRVE